MLFIFIKNNPNKQSVAKINTSGKNILPYLSRKKYVLFVFGVFLVGGACLSDIYFLSILFSSTGSSAFLAAAVVTTANVSLCVEKVTILKMSATTTELLFRGILCNILVCLAVWCGYRVKNEAAKILLIFCCIYPFILSGFEHSIANMMLFSLALMIPHNEVISISGAIHNLIPVTIGNILGGALVLGLGLWLTKVQKSE